MPMEVIKQYFALFLLGYLSRPRSQFRYIQFLPHFFVEELRGKWKMENEDYIDNNVILLRVKKRLEKLGLAINFDEALFDGYKVPMLVLEDPGCQYWKSYTNPISKISVFLFNVKMKWIFIGRNRKHSFKRRSGSEPFLYENRNHFFYRLEEGLNISNWYFHFK